MWKKIVIIAVALLLVVAIAVGGGFYAYAQSLRPDIAEENLAKDAKISVKGLDSAISSWKAKAGESAEIDFGKEITFNTITLEEPNDNMKLFRIYKDNNGEWEMFYEQDRIMDYRMCTFETTTTSKIKIEVVEADGTVKINGFRVYNRAKNENSIKVSQYLTFGDDAIVKRLEENDEGFSGYYDVVTDIIVIGQVGLDKDVNLTFENGEENFKANMEALHKIIGDRNVNIWTTIRFDQKGVDREDGFVQTANFVNENIDKITTTLEKFVNDYGITGIDYDWEYPQKKEHWKAYDKIVVETAKKVRTSVALPPWGIKFSKEAVESIEFVNVMTYDMFDDRGDHSNIKWGTYGAIQNLRMAGFDDGQILLGIPLYGRTADKSEYAWPNFSGNEEALGKFNKILKDYEYTDEDGNVHKSDAYIQSYAEARDKASYAEAMGIGGVMVFQAVCDAPYTYEYSIHRAIKDAIDN